MTDDLQHRIADYLRNNFYTMAITTGLLYGGSIKWEEMVPLLEEAAALLSECYEREMVRED